MSEQLPQISPENQLVFFNKFVTTEFTLHHPGVHISTTRRFLQEPIPEDLRMFLDTQLPMLDINFSGPEVITSQATHDLENLAGQYAAELATVAEYHLDWEKHTLEETDIYIVRLPPQSPYKKNKRL